MTKSETAWIQYAAKMGRFGWSALPGRAHRKDVAERLTARGILSRVENVAVVDGDGFVIMPERFRTGYSLTDAGKLEVRS